MAPACPVAHCHATPAGQRGAREEEEALVVTVAPGEGSGLRRPRSYPGRAAPLPRRACSAGRVAQGLGPGPGL